MGWFVFEEFERWQSAPNFDLESDLGVSLSLNDFYYRSNPVLVFPPGRRMDSPASHLARLAPVVDEIHAQDGTLIFILNGGASVSVAGAQTSLSQTRYLYDPDGEVRADYRRLLPGVESGLAMVFVLDRYGAPFAAYTAADLGRKELGVEIVEWLEFIELQCPE